MKTYRKIASLLKAMENCEKSNNMEWYGKHQQNIFDLEKSNLPSGSGFDSGCTINIDKSGPEKLVIETPYHCMNDNGYYDGWVYPSIIITPSLSFGFDIKINWKGYRGRYKDILSDYILDTIHYCLNEDI